jgi:hypothetical protein
MKFHRDGRVLRTLNSVGTREINKKGFMADEYLKLKTLAEQQGTDSIQVRSQFEKYTFGDLMKITLVMSRHFPIEEQGWFSAKKTFLAYKDDEDWMAAHKIFGTFYRTPLLAGQQTGEYARFARTTPLGLYAYKEHRDIEYMRWAYDVYEAPYLSIMLGRALQNRTHPSCMINDIKNVKKYGIIDYRSNKDLGWVTFSTDELQKLRRKACSVKDKYSLNYGAKLFKIEGLEQFDKSLQTIRDMLLQCHVCNSNHRIPDVHILDPIDWDNVPDSYDEGKTELRKL